MIKYKVGDRWIYSSEFLTEYQENGYYNLIGYVTEVKQGSITIKWENGRTIEYNEYMIKINQHRLQFDKEWYRSQKLNELGI